MQYSRLEYRFLLKIPEQHCVSMHHYWVIPLRAFTSPSVDEAVQFYYTSHITHLKTLQHLLLEVCGFLSLG